MNEIFKKEITIHDKDGNRFDLKITNEWSWEWNRYFSICSQSWQWQFNPKSDIQQELLDIWNTYHLDWMSAWTKEQMEIVNSLEDKSYDNACKVLKEKWLYEVEYKWQPYRYWSWWIYKDFPNNFQEDLFKLIDKLIEEEDEYNSRKITIEDLDDEEFINHADENCDWQYEKLMAACLHEWVSWNGLENVSVNNWWSWDIEWLEYSIYTDEEANESHLEYIKNLVDDIWFEWFIWWKDIDVSMEMNWDITISKSISIDSNERCYSLAWYDWHEHEIKINDTYYYLYRNN